MPAAVRTIASMTRRCTGARPRLWASERPPRSLIGTPIASAKASADEMRISGSISSPPTSASRSSGGSSGATLSIFSVSPYLGGLPTISVHSVAARLKMSLAADTVPPANTSGAM